MSFSPLNTQDIVISSDSVVSTLWDNNQTILTNIYKESSTTKPFLEVYSVDPVPNPTANPQFSITYGHLYGSGSSPLNSLVPQNTPTKIT